MKAKAEEARQLLQLAEEDFKVFEVLKSTKNIRWEIACFHAQQAVEKWLKAVLVAHNQVVWKTHDLVALANVLIQIGSNPPATLHQLARLSPYAVTFRYSDETDPNPVTREEVELLLGNLRLWAIQFVQGNP